MIDIENITKEELVELLEDAGINPQNLDTTRYIGWSVDDVKSEDIRPDLDDDEALNVLNCVIDKHDATIGVTWTTLAYFANGMYPPPEV